MYSFPQDRGSSTDGERHNDNETSPDMEHFKVVDMRAMEILVELMQTVRISLLCSVCPLPGTKQHHRITSQHTEN